MKIKFKNILALILSAVMLVGAIPAVSALEDDTMYFGTEVASLMLDGTSSETSVGGKITFVYPDGTKYTAVEADMQKKLKDFDVNIFCPSELYVDGVLHTSEEMTPDMMLDYTLELFLSLFSDYSDYEFVFYIEEYDVDIPPVGTTVVKISYSNGISYTITENDYSKTLADFAGESSIVHKVMFDEEGEAFFSSRFAAGEMLGISIDELSDCPIDASCYITISVKAYPITISEPDGTITILTEADDEKTFSEFLSRDVGSVMLFSTYTNGVLSDEYYEVEHGRYTFTIKELVEDFDSFCTGDSWEVNYKILSWSVVLADADAANANDVLSDLYDVVSNEEDPEKAFQLYNKYIYDLPVIDFTDEESVENSLAAMEYELYGGEYKVTEWTLWGTDGEGNFINPTTEITYENLAARTGGSFSSYPFIQPTKVEKVIGEDIEDDIEDDEEDEDTPVIEAMPSSQNVELVPGEKAFNVTVNVNEDESVTLNSNVLRTMFADMEKDSKVNISAGSFRFVLPYAAVADIAENNIILTVEINGIKFVVNGSSIEKIRAINFASIIKSDEYKQLSKETDTINVSVNANGEVFLSR